MRRKECCRYAVHTTIEKLNINIKVHFRLETQYRIFPILAHNLERKMCRTDSSGLVKISSGKVERFHSFGDLRVAMTVSRNRFTGCYLGGIAIVLHAQ
jgi:hypothetical protein